MTLVLGVTADGGVEDGEPAVVQLAHTNAVMTTAMSAGVRAMAGLPSVTLPKPSSTAIGTLCALPFPKDSENQGKSALRHWLDAGGVFSVCARACRRRRCEESPEKFVSRASRSAAFWA